MYNNCSHQVGRCDDTLSSSCDMQLVSSDRKVVTYQYFSNITTTTMILYFLYVRQQLSCSYFYDMLGQLHEFDWKVTYLMRFLKNFLYRLKIKLSVQGNKLAAFYHSEKLKSETLNIGFLLLFDNNHFLSMAVGNALWCHCCAPRSQLAPPDGQQQKPI